MKYGASIWLVSGLWFLLAGPASAQSGRTIQDVTYVRGGSVSQQLDLHLPGGTGFPTVVFVHGGSLTGEDRREAPYPAIAEAFVREGVACANIDYRLAPDHAWPDMPRDVAAAVAWVLEHIDGYGGAPDDVFLVGHSSGGHLVAIVAADSTYLWAHGLRPLDLAGAVPIGSKMDMVPWSEDTPMEKILAYMQKDRYERSVYRSDPALRESSSPMRFVNASVPPLLLLVAEAERFHPPILEEGARFVRMLIDEGVDAEIAILPDRTHKATIQRMPVNPGIRPWR